MDMYISGNAIMISAENLPEFRQLMRQAKEEAEQLNRTLAKLSRFDISIQLSVCGSNQAGDMEAASSAISDMPMK